MSIIDFMSKNPDFVGENHERQELPSTVLYSLKSSMREINFITKILVENNCYSRDTGIEYSKLRDKIKSDITGKPMGDSKTCVRFNSQRFFELYDTSPEVIYIGPLMKSIEIKRDLYKEFFFMGMMRQEVFRTVVATLSSLISHHKTKVTLEEINTEFNVFREKTNNIGNNPKVAEILTDLIDLGFISKRDNIYVLLPYKPSKYAVLFSLLYHSIEWNIPNYKWEYLLDEGFIEFWLSNNHQIRSVLKELSIKGQLYLEDTATLDQYALLLNDYDAYFNWLQEGD